MRDGGAYTWNNTSAEEKLGLSARDRANFSHS